MNDSLVTVIIPVYKVEAYLNRCVQSVVDQTYKNLEIILVDDGSPDNCPAMCDAWAQKDERIRVIHQENGGLSAARNAGLDTMTGNYVAFVDSDDYLHRQNIEILLTILNHTKSDVSACRFVLSSELQAMQDQQYDINHLDPIHLYTGHDCFCGIDSPGIITSACARLYRSTVFSGLRFTPGRVCEDGLIMPSVYLATGQFVVCDLPLYYYYRSSQHDSIMNSKLNALKYTTIDNTMDHYRLYKQHSASKLMRIKAYLLFIKIIKAYVICCEQSDQRDLFRFYYRRTFGFLMTRPREELSFHNKLRLALACIPNKRYASFLKNCYKDEYGFLDFSII